MLARVQNVVVTILRNMCPPGMHISPSTDIVTSFNSDDLSFEFIPKVEAELGIDIPQAEWYRVNTVAEVCKLLETHLRQRGQNSS